jgi:ComF family protein
MQRLLDVLLPPTCPGCGRVDLVICPGCRAALARRQSEPVGVPLGLPANQPAGILQLEWCCSYTGPARACLHALKYEGELRLVEPLAELMAQRWRRAAIGGDVIVPVPAHAARRRQRGFDQAELLARAVGRLTGMAVVPALRRATQTTAQHQLGRQARAGNVRAAFEVADGYAQALVGRWAVLVDDIVTTGATLAGCARALRAANVPAVSALALARER